METKQQAIKAPPFEAMYWSDEKLAKWEAKNNPNVTKEQRAALNIKTFDDMYE